MDQGRLDDKGLAWGPEAAAGCASKACWRRVTGLCIVLLLAACGGGGSSPEASSPPVPAASAESQVNATITDSAISAVPAGGEAPHLAINPSPTVALRAKLPPASVERQVNATITDSAISAFPAGGEAPHLAINPSPTVAPRAKLLVFLPGTQGRPSQYTYILRAGASRGFHAVGINYPNQTAMGSLCQFSADPDCYWTARNEVIFGNGTPVSGQSAVTRADSVVNRLNKLLKWLANNQSAEGWGQFLRVDGTVDWSKVVLAGHSQGGGHVGVLAKTVSLSRAVYFSAPEDWNELANLPAGWIAARPNVTAATLQFGFGSDLDTLVPNAHAFVHWDGLGLPRPSAGPVLVDGAAAPFFNSHQLRTSLSFNPASTAPTPALRFHGVTVVDTSTPIDAKGRPLFDTNGVWKYLCFQ